MPVFPPHTTPYHACSSNHFNFLSNVNLSLLSVFYICSPCTCAATDLLSGSPLQPCLVLNCLTLHPVAPERSSAVTSYKSHHTQERLITLDCNTSSIDQTLLGKTEPQPTRPSTVGLRHDTHNSSCKIICPL